MAAFAQGRVRWMRESGSPLHPRCSRGERRQRSAFRLDRKHLASSPFAPASRGRFAVLLRLLSSGVLPPVVGSEVPGVHVVLASGVCAGDELQIGRAPSELQSLAYLVCRLLLEKKKKKKNVELQKKKKNKIIKYT